MPPPASVERCTRRDGGIRSSHLGQPPADISVDAVERSAGEIVVAVEVSLAFTAQTPAEAAGLHLAHVPDEPEN